MRIFRNIRALLSFVVILVAIVSHPSVAWSTGWVEPEPISRPELDIEKWTITAYCPCEKCCGQWAVNRPPGPVVGAYGIPLREGASVACPLPCGTVLEIEGVGTRIAHDTTADFIVERYDGKIIDLFFESHEDALAFGKQIREVMIMKP